MMHTGSVDEYGTMARAGSVERSEIESLTPTTFHGILVIWRRKRRVSNSREENKA